MIVVTGGTGFIGSNLVAGLEEQGQPDLVVCDRLTGTEKLRNVAKHELAALLLPEQLPDFLARHASEIRAVLHMGAITSTTETDVDRLIATNVHLPSDLWRWCAENEVPFIWRGGRVQSRPKASGCQPVCGRSFSWPT